MRTRHKGWIKLNLVFEDEFPGASFDASVEHKRSPGLHCTEQTDEQLVQKDLAAIEN